LYKDVRMAEKELVLASLKQTVIRIFRNDKTRIEYLRLYKRSRSLRRFG